MGKGLSMTPIGETLRRERLKRNLDLEQISRELKISTHTLEAIENEQFDRLPGAVFAKSFVRQYARVLELDDAEMAAEVQSRFEPEPLPTFESVSKESSRMVVKVPGLRSGPAWKSIFLRLAMLALIVLVASGLYVFWQQSRATQAARRPAVQQPSAPPSGSQIASASQPPALAPELRTPAAAGEQQADRMSPPNGASQAPAAVAPAPVQQAYVNPDSGPNDAVRVKLTAQEPVWVRASNNGKYMFSGTIEPSQTKEIDVPGQVELLVGNAGGINIELNGKPIGLLGPKGQIRTVQLTSGGFNIVLPKPAAPVDRF